MKNKILLSIVIIILILTSSTVPASWISHQASNTIEQEKNEVTKITCYFGGTPKTVTVTMQAAQDFQTLLTKYTKATADNPQSTKTQALQQQLLAKAEAFGLLPKGMTATEVHTQLQQYGEHLAAHAAAHASLLPYGTTDREFLCNFATSGSGSAFPIIILPRLIPIIQLPIPRLFVGWKTSYGITSVGGLVSRTGFIAEGSQQGLALGFWGIGFSVFLPPLCGYGLIGYAAYTKVTADYIEQWPPNNPPEISAVYPLNGATYVPITTTQLQFHIQDADGDRMSYSVTTSPDVGGGNGNLKLDGTYTIPISGLQSSTTYSWAVQVSDTKDLVTKTFTFTTEYFAPQILDPAPINGAYYVPITLSSLNFTLHDHQNDPIDWTLQTNPAIGSGSGTHVSNGRYSVPIQTSLLQYDTTYTWYLNATDGTNPNHQVFTFTVIKEGIDPYLYVGGESQTIARYSKEDLTKNLESGNYGTKLNDVISDGQYLYTAGNQGAIWQLWPSNLTIRTVSANWGIVSDLACDGTYVYAGGWPSVNRVAQFWASNLTKKQESIVLPDNGVCGLSCQGGYLYAVGGLDWGYGYIYQFWTSNMTVRHVANVDGGRFWSVLAVGSSIFVGSTSPYQGGVVLQYRASDLAEINSAPYGGTIYTLCFDGTYLYAGGHNTQKVFKYWPTNLTKVGESSNYGGAIDEISYDGVYLYIGGATNRVWQLQPSDLSKKAETPDCGGDVLALWTGP